MICLHFPHPCTAPVRLFELEDRKELGDRDRGHNCGPEVLEWRLLESQVCRHINVATKEWVKVLAHKDAQSCKHRNTAVLQLDLPVEEKLLPVHGGAEPKRVKVVHRCTDTRHELLFLLHFINHLDQPLLGFCVHEVPARDDLG